VGDPGRFSSHQRNHGTIGPARKRSAGTLIRRQNCKERRNTVSSSNRRGSLGPKKVSNSTAVPNASRGHIDCEDLCQKNGRKRIGGGTPLTSAKKGKSTWKCGVRGSQKRIWEPSLLSANPDAECPGRSRRKYTTVREISRKKRSQKTKVIREGSPNKGGFGAWQCPVGNGSVPRKSV